MLTLPRSPRYFGVQALARWLGSREEFGGGKGPVLSSHRIVVSNEGGMAGSTAVLVFLVPPGAGTSSLDMLGSFPPPSFLTGLGLGLACQIRVVCTVQFIRLYAHPMVSSPIPLAPWRTAGFYAMR